MLERAFRFESGHGDQGESMSDNHEHEENKIYAVQVVLLVEAPTAHAAALITDQHEICKDCPREILSIEEFMGT